MPCCALPLRRCRALLLPIAALAAEGAEAKRPFTVEDLVRINRVSEPALSPDGKTVVFTLRETDIAANRGRQDLWTLDLTTKGAQPRRLTSIPRTIPARSGPRTVGMCTSCRRAAARRQVWRLPAGGGEAEQVTDLPLDVGSFRLAPNGARLAVTCRCVPRLCGPELHQRARSAQSSASKATGKVSRSHLRAPLGHVERRAHLPAVRDEARATAAQSSRSR